MRTDVHTPGSAKVYEASVLAVCALLMIKTDTILNCRFVKLSRSVRSMPCDLSHLLFSGGENGARNRAQMATSVRPGRRGSPYRGRRCQKGPGFAVLALWPRKYLHVQVLKKPFSERFWAHGGHD